MLNILILVASVCEWACRAFFLASSLFRRESISYIRRLGPATFGILFGIVPLYLAVVWPRFLPIAHICQLLECLVYCTFMRSQGDGSMHNGILEWSRKNRTDQEQRALDSRGYGCQNLRERLRTGPFEILEILEMMRSILFSLQSCCCWPKQFLLFLLRDSSQQLCDVWSTFVLARICAQLFLRRVCLLCTSSGRARSFNRTKNRRLKQLRTFGRLSIVTISVLLMTIASPAMEV